MRNKRKAGNLCLHKEIISSPTRAGIFSSLLDVSSIGASNEVLV